MRYAWHLFLAEHKEDLEDFIIKTKMGSEKMLILNKKTKIMSTSLVTIDHDEVKVLDSFVFLALIINKDE